ncbi:MAG: glycosyltransferase [Oscillatoria sp. PMC 1068.18]|nr:glycosyltransferase [Oscillatoria sp. PMC 1076.18]MEC4988808.1 glycosyltransferase [Oscillatoria sp. PMC 1068.18]
MKNQQSSHVAILANPAGGGGITRVVINLLKGMIECGIKVDFVLDCKKGKPYLADVPEGVKVVDLQAKITGGTSSALKIVPPLIRYLRREKPDLLLSHLTIANGVAAIAKTLAGVPVYLALVEHLSWFEDQKLSGNLQNKISYWWRKLLYPRADAIVAVSAGMARGLENYLQLKLGSVQVIYNPVVDENLFEKAKAELAHPWLVKNQPPVILGIGRLVAEKDFSTLIRAFAELKKQANSESPGKARLIILGEGNLRKQLETEIKELELEEEVSLPGYVENPYAYLSKAAVFVLSSKFEGLPTVLIEAIACGSPVISTDCPHGPREILADGKYGQLVPVGDLSALATAMHSALLSPREPAKSSRWRDFSVEKAVTAYLQLIN